MLSDTCKLLIILTFASLGVELTLGFHLAHASATCLEAPPPDGVYTSADGLKQGATNPLHDYLPPTRFVIVDGCISFYESAMPGGNFSVMGMSVDVSGPSSLKLRFNDGTPRLAGWEGEFVTDHQDAHLLWRTLPSVDTQWQTWRYALIRGLRHDVASLLHDEEPMVLAAAILSAARSGSCRHLLDGLSIALSRADEHRFHATDNARYVLSSLPP